MVLVGHCTRKDCEIADGTATRRHPNATRTVLAFLLDITLLLQPLFTTAFSHFCRGVLLTLSGKYWQGK
jgi:hypothetical protein